MKASPGPWKRGIAFFAPAIYDAQNKVIAQLQRLNIPDEEFEANAHLIRAAPSLYNALKAMEWVEMMWLSGETIKEGCPTCGGTKPHHTPDCTIDAALKAAEGK